MDIALIVCCVFFSGAWLGSRIERHGWVLRADGPTAHCVNGKFYHIRTETSRGARDALLGPGKELERLRKIADNYKHFCEQAEARVDELEADNARLRERVEAMGPVVEAAIALRVSMGAMSGPTDPIDLLHAWQTFGASVMEAVAAYQQTNTGGAHEVANAEDAD